MIVGVEETTDMRYPQTKIVHLSSEAAARKWLSGGGGFAWPGAADESIRPSMQNWHRRLRSAYVLPPRFRLDKREVERLMGWPRHDSADTVRACMYRRAAVREIDADKIEGDEHRGAGD